MANAIASLICAPCSIGCSSLMSGIGSWIADVTGLAENVLGTTAPIFKHAAAYGALNGVVNVGLNVGTELVVETTGVRHTRTEAAIGLVQDIIRIASRYGVAKVCKDSFGMNVPMAYVHIGTAIKTPLALCNRSWQFLDPEAALRREREALRMFGLSEFD